MNTLSFQANQFLISTKQRSWVKKMFSHNPPRTLYMFITMVIRSICSKSYVWMSCRVCDQTLEYVSEEHGGRVKLAKAYYDGLSKSLRKNFDGSGLIASMEQCNDFFFLATNQISMARVGKNHNLKTFKQV